METSIVKYDVNKAKKRLQREIKDLQGTVDLIHAATYLKAKCLWNISRNRLYEAAGYADMKAWTESIGLSYRRVQQLIQKGDAIAEQAFRNAAADEERYLTIAHVREYTEAQKELMGEAATDPLLLEAGSFEDLAPCPQTPEETKALTRKIAALRRRKRDDAELDPDDAPAHPYNKLDDAQIRTVDEFEDRREALFSEHDFLRLAYEGGADMLSEFQSYDLDVQGELIDRAVERVMELRR